MDLTAISLMTKDGKHIFIYIFPIHIKSLVKSCLNSLPFYCFSYYRVENVPLYMDTRHVTDICLTIIFSQYMDNYFIFLTCLFEGEKFLVLRNHNLSISILELMLLCLIKHLLNSFYSRYFSPRYCIVLILLFMSLFEFIF